MVKAQSSKSTNDMTVGSPLRAIIKFAIPLILGYILQQMYLIIDAAIVGRWIGVGALAAVGASSSIMFLIMGFCNGSCAGFAIPIAQAFGAKDYAKMRAYVSNSIRIAVVFAVVITFLSCIFCGKILHLVNTPKEVFDDAYIFLMLQFAAIPFTIAYNLLSGQIRALGNSKQPFYFLITASVINIILDGILILGMGLGVEGAGIATWLSQGISVLLCIWFIKKKMQILIPKGEERKFDNKKVSILLNKDAGLNGGAEIVSVDLSKAPGGLTVGEKAAIAYVFSQRHGVEGLTMTFDELREEGYLAGEKTEDGKTAYSFTNGLLFTITPDESAEGEGFSLPVVCFSAEKWRSPLGAYYFTECTASRGEGSWEYSVGAEMIS